MHPTRTVPLLCLAALSCLPQYDGAVLAHEDLPSVIRQSVVQGGPNPSAVMLPLNNSGTCPLVWNRTVTTVDGNGWLNVSPNTGTVVPNGMAALTVALDVITSSLKAGTYTGTITITGTCMSTGQPAAGSPATVAVNLTVTANVAGISLSTIELNQDVVTLADTWGQLTTTGGPSVRREHTMVWTGNQALVFGGNIGSGACTLQGGKYDPIANTWTPINTIGPNARGAHTAVWTGSRMAIFGGDCGTLSPVLTHTLGQTYDPVADAWTTLPMTGEPGRRAFHSAVYAGGSLNQMIIWGGHDGTVELDTGGRFDFTGNAWLPAMSTVNAPSPRRDHSAVWTGSRMIVWGGRSGGMPLGDGASYDPSTNTWTPIALFNAPAARFGHRAVWTGTHLVVYGGTAGTLNALASGGMYHPATNTWRPLSTMGATGRSSHVAVWTGSHMLVWGGEIFSGPMLDTGATYRPGTDVWQSISTTGAPTGRRGAAAVWTGVKLIVFGGEGGSGEVNTGGIYQ